LILFDLIDVFLGGKGTASVEANGGGVMVASDGRMRLMIGCC